MTIMMIAIDGTAASGKGTLGRLLAESLGFDYMDTGRLYRELGWYAKKNDFNIKALTHIQIMHLTAELGKCTISDRELRTAQIGDFAAEIAKLADIRIALLKKQRDFAYHPPHGKGAILDGRDIGTVVLPDADIKFFIDADVKIRAKRRYHELKATYNHDIDEMQICADLEKRDKQDRTRAVAPLKKTDDAIFIDSSQKTPNDMLQEALTYIKTDI